VKKARSLYYFSSFPSCALLVLFVVFLMASDVIDVVVSIYSVIDNNNVAYGHVTETPGADSSNIMSKPIGNYAVLFQIVPPSAQRGENSTLMRFSILQNNQDISGVFAALTIKEKSSDNISQAFPYMFYEFGDIDFRHTFQNAVDREVILEARITGDPRYQNNPLVASFDLPATTIAVGGKLGIAEEIIFISVLIALPVGIIILILDFNKRTRGGGGRGSST
jgi:hypothetical protein